MTKNRKIACNRADLPSVARLDVYGANGSWTMSVNDGEAQQLIISHCASLIRRHDKSRGLVLSVDISTAQTILHGNDGWMGNSSKTVIREHVGDSRAIVFRHHPRCLHWRD